VARGAPPQRPQRKGFPTGGMGGARTDGGYPVTEPIHKKSIAITEKKMPPLGGNT